MTSVERWRGRDREQADDLTLLIAEYVTVAATAKLS
jgi:hypothetical protein